MFTGWLVDCENKKQKNLIVLEEYIHIFVMWLLCYGLGVLKFLPVLGRNHNDLIFSVAPSLKRFRTLFVSQQGHGFIPHMASVYGIQRASK